MKKSLIVKVSGDELTVKFGRPITTFIMSLIVSMLDGIDRLCNEEDQKEKEPFVPPLTPQKPYSPPAPYPVISMYACSPVEFNKDDNWKMSTTTVGTVYESSGSGKTE